MLDLSNNLECSNCGLFWGGHRSEETLMAVAKSPWVAGQFAWTGFDYISECFPFEWPAHGGHFGIIDLVGFPKDIFYLYQSCWTEKPMVHIVPQDGMSQTKRRSKDIVFTPIEAYAGSSSNQRNRPEPSG